MSLFDGLSLIRFVKQSPALMRALTPVSAAYARAAGHRQVGLKYDDLIIEENDTVQKALGRLTERESYDRAARLKAATQFSLTHRDAPKEQWITPDQDKRYLTPKIREIQDEAAERADWDTIKVERK